MTKTRSLNCVFLAGAPRVEDLKWDEAALIEQHGFSRPAKHHYGTSATTSAQSDISSPKWRVVTRDYPIVNATTSDEAEFLSTANLQQDVDEQDFFEHSIVHLDAVETLDLPLLTPTSQHPTDIESFYSAISTSEHDLDLEKHIIASPLPRRLPITDLKHVPGASRLEQLAPQTMTIDVLVGVVAVQPVRRIQLRRNSTEMDLVEVIVGDETRSGFTITVWLPLPTEGTSNALRLEVESLRTGDLLLISNLALTSWKGSVYGQSLSRRGIRTRLWPLQPGRHAHASTVAAKIDRVIQWKQQFLDRADDRTSDRRGSGTDVLPPDTP